jgi:short-subunit dehydrogenase
MANGRALVTGGSVGIGAALAEVFAAHGHDLILVARTRAKLEARGRDIQQRFGVDVVCLPEDLTDPQGARRLHEAVLARGLDVHYLVNNAGVGLYGKFATTDLDAEVKMIQLNATSVVDLTKRFLPAMIERRSGRILCVASTAAFVPGPWMSIYYATKAFVLSFAQAIDYELKPHGISVTCLCPGPTESEFKVRAGSQRSRLFEAFVMDAPRVACVGYEAMMKGKSVGAPQISYIRQRMAANRGRITILARIILCMKFLLQLLCAVGRLEMQEQLSAHATAASRGALRLLMQADFSRALLSSTSNTLGLQEQGGRCFAQPTVSHGKF